MLSVNRFGTSGSKVWYSCFIN